MYDHDIDPPILAKVATRLSVMPRKNENAWRRQTISEEDILNARMVSDPLTQYMLCSPGEGAPRSSSAAASICRAYPMRGPSTCAPPLLRTRQPQSFDVYSPALGIELSPSPSVAAAQAAFRTGRRWSTRDRYRASTGHGVRRGTHTPRGCGLCADGEQTELYRRGATEIGGDLPVNTDGGLYRER